MRRAHRTTRGGSWIDEQSRPAPQPRYNELLWNIDSGVSEESCRHKDKLPTPFSLSQRVEAGDVRAVVSAFKSYVTPKAESLIRVW